MAARFTLHHGDCLQVLRGMGDASVDAIVCDPPAGIAFMGKDWDKDKGGRDAWIAWMQSVAQECLRVIKHGGHALVWALPRTSHWTGMAWENAGWEPRDKIVHLFGTGFPKSLNVSASIEGLLTRGSANKTAFKHLSGDKVQRGNWGIAKMQQSHGQREKDYDTEAESDARLSKLSPTTDEAKEWEGWGTALKPAAEDWWLMRKPLDGTVAGNVLKHGTGALNIDGCRVDGPPSGLKPFVRGVEQRESQAANHHNVTFTDHPQGRWPANLMHDGSPEVVAGFPSDRPGMSGGGDGRRDASMFGVGGVSKPEHFRSDKGSASRFFYCAKASRRDREEGCEHLEAKSGAEAVDREEGSAGLNSPRAGASRTAGKVKNHHPTVKNTDLMRYLCRLVTPKEGVVLDPFMGSGSTGKGCMYEGFRFIGIDQDPEYVEIARARIEYALRNGGFVDEIAVKPAPKAGSSLKVLRRKVSDEQIDLFAQPIAQDEEPT